MIMMTFTKKINEFRFAYAGNIAVVVVTVLTATELQCHLWFLPSSSQN